MKVLITGGAGFIGSNVALYFLEKGHSVVIVDNLSTGYRENIPDSDRVEFIQGDIRDLEIVAKAAKGCDVILHLAASVGNLRSLNNPQEDSTINVIGTLNILEIARKAGIRRIVYSSSAAIFGELKRLPIDEEHPLAPDTPYGASKLGGELQALCYARLYDMQSVCLRYFNVYGPNQRYDAYGNVIPIFATHKLKGEPLTIYGDGKQTRDFIHVQDIAQANYLAATSPKATGAYNIGSGQSFTISQLAQWINELEGTTPVEIRHAPLRKGEVRDSLADIQKAKRELGYEPKQKLPEGLKQYWQWINGL